MRAMPIVADAREGLRALHAELAAGRLRRDDDPAYRERVAGLKGEWDAIVDQLRTVNGEPGDLGQAEVIGIVNDAVGGHATVVCAAGSLPGDLLRLWRVDDPKAYHVEYGFSCMGYEIAAGLGVRMADPDREVVVMVGDGSYLMMNSEIVTAVAEGLKLTIVVLDNHGFQCILALQRSVGVPDFANELRFRDPASNRLTGPYVPVDFRAACRGDGRAGPPGPYAGRAARRARPGPGERPDQRDPGAHGAREAGCRLRVLVGRAGRRPPANRTVSGDARAA